MRHRMQCSVLTDQTVETSARGEECPEEQDQEPAKKFTLPGKKWDRKQKISTGMLVSQASCEYGLYMCYTHTAQGKEL